MGIIGTGTRSGLMSEVCTNMTVISLPLLGSRSTPPPLRGKGIATVLRRPAKCATTLLLEHLALALAMAMALGVDLEVSGVKAEAFAKSAGAESGSKVRTTSEFPRCYLASQRRRLQ